MDLLPTKEESVESTKCVKQEESINKSIKSLKPLADDEDNEGEWKTSSHSKRNKQKRVKQHAVNKAERDKQARRKRWEEYKKAEDGCDEMKNLALNRLENQARGQYACYRVPSRYDEDNRYGDSYNNGCWEVTETVQCQVRSHQPHTMKVSYIRNGRDVDILAWFEDGERKGYYME